MSPESLARISNVMIYSSMLVLTFAMFSFAASFAGGRRRASSSVTESTMSAGGAAVLTQTVVETEIPGRRASNIGISLTWLAFALLLAGVVLRGVWAGRAPWGNMYEFSITAALGVLGVFLIANTRIDLRWLGLFIVIPVLLTLGVAVTVLYTEAAQLVPALKSYWLVIHVLAAIICSGAFTIAAATAGLSFVSDRAERKAAAGVEVTGILATRIPNAERLRSITNKTLAFAFPLWTFTVVAGAIWAENAWGRYWGWDPKETWAFITWVIYAAYLHARSTAGWRGNKASLIALAGWIAFLMNYFGVNFLANSLHSYAGVGS